MFFFHKAEPLHSDELCYLQIESVWGKPVPLFQFIGALATNLDKHWIYCLSIVIINSDIGCCISYFSCCYSKYPDKSNLRKEGFDFVVTVGCSGKPQWKELEAAITLYHSQEAESDECWYTAHFHLFIWFKIEGPTHGVAVFPSHIIWVLPHKHAQRLT